MANRKYTTRKLVLDELPNNLPGQVYKSTTLNGSMGTTGTVVTVASLSGFPDMGDLLIESEYVAYEGTSAAGTQFATITRAANNTSAGTHADGATVYNGFLDRRIEKMTAYIDTILSQRYQTLPSYSATGSCPETVEFICRVMSAHEAFVQMGIEQNVGEGGGEGRRYKEARDLLDRISKGQFDLPIQTGTDALTFGTSGVGTLPYDDAEAPISKRSIIPESVVVSCNGTTYVNDEDYTVRWHETHQKWILNRASDSDITDAGTAIYDYTWLKSWQGVSPINQQKTVVLNRGFILRG